MPRPYPLPARAKETTPEEAQQRRDDLHALEGGIKATIGEGRRALWKLAAQLDLWEEEQGWHGLGYEDLTHWLAAPEIGMTKSRYYDLVSTYRELKQREVDAAVMQELEVSKVVKVLPAVKQHRVNLEDALDDAKTLGYRDLREKYRDPAADRPDPGGSTSGTGGSAALPPDDDPIVASAVEPGAAGEVLDDDDEPIEVEAATASGRPEAKLAQKAQPTPSGQVADDVTEDPTRRGAELLVRQDSDGGLTILGWRQQFVESRNMRDELRRLVQEGRRVLRLRVVGEHGPKRPGEPAETAAGGLDRP
jgi:hypothetical protein